MLEDLDLKGSKEGRDPLWGAKDIEGILEEKGKLANVVCGLENKAAGNGGKRGVSVAVDWDFELWSKELTSKELLKLDRNGDGLLEFFSAATATAAY